MANAKAQPASFEDSLARLESIVSQLESGDLPLEHALEIFEDGVGLARRYTCKAFVMPQIQIGFRAVIGDKHFTMFKR